MQIIGEKINGTRKKVAKAISERDAVTIRDLAVRQVQAGQISFSLGVQLLARSRCRRHQPLSPEPQEPRITSSVGRTTRRGRTAIVKHASREHAWH